MKQILPVFFIVFLFLSQHGWSSELDEKYLICETFKEKKFPNVGVYGFYFWGDRVNGVQIVSHGSKAKIESIESASSRYYTDIKEVRWHHGNFRLDRETLVLKEDSRRTHQCKVTKRTDGEEIINMHLDKLNNEIKERMKDNKI